MEDVFIILTREERVFAICYRTSALLWWAPTAAISEQSEHLSSNAFCSIWGTKFGSSCSVMNAPSFDQLWRKAVKFVWKLTSEEHLDNFARNKYKTEDNLKEEDCNSGSWFLKNLNIILTYLIKLRGLMKALINC